LRGYWSDGRHQCGQLILQQSIHGQEYTRPSEHEHCERFRQFGHGNSRTLTDKQLKLKEKELFLKYQNIWCLQLESQHILDHLEAAVSIAELDTTANLETQLNKLTYEYNNLVYEAKSIRKCSGRNYWILTRIIFACFLMNHFITR
jgi:hypothetical protein